MHLVDFIIRIYHDARSPERQTVIFFILSKPAPDHEPIQWDLETSFSGVKQPEREVDRATVSSSKVNNVWKDTSIQLCVFMT